MDNLVDIFSGDAFSVRTLTDAINMVPNQYGRIGKLGLFEEKGVNTDIVMIEINDGVLNLIPSTKRGDPAPKNKSGKRKVKPFTIPRLALDDKILPSDIQNVRAFGSQDLQTPASVVNDKLIDLSRKHDQTQEFLKCGAIAGIVKDANGDTIVDLFTEFDVTEKSVAFALGTDATKVQSKVREVVGHIEDNLKGDTMSHVVGMCDATFFDKLVKHPAVVEAYQYAQSMQNTVLGMGAPTANPLRDDVRAGFFWQGVFWQEYRGTSTFFNDDGTTTAKPFIESTTCRFFPVGTTQTFKQYNAPADWMETANTMGMQKYAKVVPEIGGRYVEVLSQSCPLPLCLRPAVLVKGTTN